MTLSLQWYSPNGTTPSGDYEEPAWADEGSTVGKVQGTLRNDTSTRLVRVGGVDRPVLAGGLHIPIDAPVPSVDWEAVVESVGEVDDPALLGVCYRVVDVTAKSFATARRLDVVQVPNVHP